MELKHLKSVQDKGAFFLVDHAKHGTFKVAKKGLSKSTLKTVQAMCTGGVVQHFDEGGEVVQSMDTVPPPPDVLPAAVPATYGFESGSTLNPAPGSELTSVIPGALNSVGGDAALKSQVQAQAPVMADALTSEAPALARTGPEAAAPPAQAPSDATPQPPAAPVATVKPPALPSGAGIFKAMDAEQNALRAGADATANEELNKQKILNEFTTQEETRAKAFDQSMKTQDDEYKRIQQDIATSKIDPDKMWNNMSTGNKVMAAISMALGGIASGISGGPNHSLEIIQKSIDRDIDAQKTDLGKKQSLLQDNLRKTGDLREAEVMTRAQMLAAVQGKLAAANAKFGGDKAKANADFLANQIAQQRESLKFQIAQQRSLAAGQQNQQQQLADAYARLAQGTGTPADEVIMGEKAGERIVDTPSGRGLAHDKDSAEKYREEAATYGNARDIVSKLQTASKRLSMGTLDPKEKGTLQTQVAMLELQLPAAIAGLKRLNENEYNAAKENTPNPGDVLQLHEKAIGKLNALGSLLDNRMRVAANQYLVRPAARSIPDGK